MKTFEQIFSKMKANGTPVPQERFTIQIADARDFFVQCLKAVLDMQHKQFVWLPEYDDIVSWLTDNKGQGLFLYGNCGRGKSLIARYLIPAAVSEYYNRIFTVVDAVQFAQHIDDYIGYKFLCIDDIGTEDFTNEYGSKRMAFSELMDLVEKRDKTVVITTNLNVEQLREKYGDRTVERIISTMRRVCFKGDSLRK